MQSEQPFTRQRIGLVLGPILFLIMLMLPEPVGLGAAGWHAAAVVTLMAIWWITEAIPIAATALVPIVAFPLLGAGSIGEATTPFADPIIFLFMGGFLIALAMQRWGLHRRVALRIIRSVGTSPRSLVAGFMISAALLSMWVSNTATALMLLPVALSVIQLAERNSPVKRGDAFSVALLLGLAYGCNIGGMGTLIGTPPNALLVGFLNQEYGITISFVSWLTIGVPLVVVSLPLAFLILTRISFPLPNEDLPGIQDVLDEEFESIGSMSSEEKAVAFVFVLTAVLWITRPLVANYIVGISDAGIAMLGGLILFVIPSNLRENVFLMDWQTARLLPWDTLILFGGGLSLASAFTRTGLSLWFGELLASFGALPIIFVIIVVATAVIFLTELTSNTATAATLLPVVAALAVGIGQDPLLLAIPAALAASCAFMLPVATPPNAIVYASERVTIPEMARGGLLLNLLFIVLISFLSYTLVVWAFGVSTLS